VVFESRPVKIRDLSTPLGLPIGSAQTLSIKKWYTTDCMKDPHICRNGVSELVPRWEKCSNVIGGYAEKVTIRQQNK
jgi:hypothetical protein